MSNADKGSKGNKFDKMFDGIQSQPDAQSSGSDSAPQLSGELVNHEAVKVTRGTHKSIGKSKDPNYGRLTFYLPDSVLTAIKIEAAIRKQELSDIGEWAVKEWLLKHAPHHFKTDSNSENNE